MMLAGGKTRPRRAAFEIIMDILTVLRERGKIGPTKVMYMSNLSWDLMRRHLTTLVFSKLVATTPDSEFFITERGAQCLAMFEQASLMIVSPPPTEPNFTLPKRIYIR